MKATLRGSIRALWFAAGIVAGLVAVIGFFVPLLPTVPFLLVALWCFSHSCARCERWLLEHPRFGPQLRDWREHRAVSLEVKRFAIVMMAISSVTSAWMLESPWRWVPGLCCAAVGWWLWRLPTRALSDGSTDATAPAAKGR